VYTNEDPDFVGDRTEGTYAKYVPKVAFGPEQLGGSIRAPANLNWITIVNIMSQLVDNERWR
jgi:hypothetical protein